MAEILASTGAKLWGKDDYGELWLSVFAELTGTSGKSNIRLIDEAIGKYAPLASPALTGVPTAPTAASGTNTTQVATTGFVQQEITDLKKSVSDGKTTVANAITAKGITTATDATFATMATNIGAIETGGGMSLNVFTQETEPETKDGIWVQTANPHQSVVVGDKNYVPNSDPIECISWTDAPSFMKYVNIAVVFNSYIYAFKSNKFYAYDGVVTPSPVNVSIPSGFDSYYPDGDGSVYLVYNDELHILSDDDISHNKLHYAFNGTSWREVSTLPYSLGTPAGVVYNNEIHLLGSKYTDMRYNHYAFNGTSWREVSTLPVPAMARSIAVVYNNEIHLFPSESESSSTSPYTTRHYAFNGTSWREVSTLPYEFSYGGVVVYHDKIHIMGNGGFINGITPPSGTCKSHYSFDGNSWIDEGKLPTDSINPHALVYNDTIYLYSAIDYDENKTYIGYHNYISTITLQYPEPGIGSKISIYQNPSNTIGTYATNFISGAPITGENNKFPSGFDDVFYIDESENVEESPIYYGDGTQWIKFKN